MRDAQDRLRQEEDRLAVGWIVAAGGTALLVIAVALACAYGVSGASQVNAAPSEARAERVAGVLQTTIAPNRPRPRAAAEEPALLESYAWVDRERGIAAIPIGEAMDLVAAGRVP